jgi:uncharacterized protein YjbJ (UPF0337 family)
MNRFMVPLGAQPKEKNKQMGQETSKQKGSQGEKEKDEGWLKEAVGSLSRDDKERTEEQIDGATNRIEDAASSIKEGQAKEASSALSSGRHRDKVAGTVDMTKGWVKETSSSLTGSKEKRAEGRADQLKGVAKSKKGHVKDLFKFP